MKLHRRGNLSSYVVNVLALMLPSWVTQVLQHPPSIPSSLRRCSGPQGGA